MASNLIPPIFYVEGDTRWIYIIIKNATGTMTVRMWEWYVHSSGLVLLAESFTSVGRRIATQNTRMKFNEYFIDFTADYDDGRYLL